MYFSAYSFFDCLNLPGKGTFSGIELEKVELGLTLVVWDSLGGLDEFGKVWSSLAWALLPVLLLAATYPPRLDLIWIYLSPLQPVYHFSM